MVKSDCSKSVTLQYLSRRSQKNTSSISSFVEVMFSELSPPGAVELLKQVRTRDGFLQVEEKANNSSQEETRKSINFFA